MLTIRKNGHTLRVTRGAYNTIYKFAGYSVVGHNGPSEDKGGLPEGEQGYNTPDTAEEQEEDAEDDFEDGSDSSEEDAEDDFEDGSDSSEEDAEDDFEDGSDSSEEDAEDDFEDGSDSSEEEQEEAPETPIGEMEMDELVAYAKSLGIKVKSGMKKKGLRAAIREKISE